MRSSRSSRVSAKPSARWAKFCVTSPIRAVTRFSKPERRPSTAISIVLAEEASRMAAASALSVRRLSKPVRREVERLADLRDARVDQRAERCAALAERRGKRAAAIVEHLGDALDVRLDLLAQRSPRAAAPSRPGRRWRAIDVLQRCPSAPRMRSAVSLAGGREAALGVLQRRLDELICSPICAATSLPAVLSRSSASASAASIAAELLHNVAGNAVAEIVQPVVGARRAGPSTLSIFSSMLAVMRSPVEEKRSLAAASAASIDPI